MRFYILFALIFAAYTYVTSNPISEEPAVALVEPTLFEGQAAGGNAQNTLLDVADVGGEQAEEADRIARGFGWGYKRWGGGYGRGYGGYGRGYGGYGYGGYGYNPYGYRRSYYWG